MKLKYKWNIIIYLKKWLKTGYLVQLIDGDDQMFELLLENVGSSEIEKLSSGIDRDLLGKLQKELVHQVGVLHDDRNLLKWERKKLF